jgi:hypothetical protein
MSAPFQKWMSEVVFYLMREGGVAYGLFLQHARSYAAPRPLAGHYPVAAGVSDDMELVVRLHAPTVMNMSLPVASELLKLCILPLVFGQFGTRRETLVNRYGRATYQIASNLAISEWVNVNLLKRESIHIPTPQDYGMHALKSTSFYCAGLSEECGVALHKDVELKEAYEKAPYPRTFDDDDDDDEGEVMDEPMPMPCDRAPVVAVLEPETLPPESVDLSVANKIESVKNEAAQREGGSGSSSGGRGWDSADTCEFIKQVRRKPRMPWTVKLRKMESAYRSTVRTPSRMRPSRRHPLHFGRIKQSSLLVWFGVDTSGSMGADRLKLVDAELKGIHNRGAAIRVLHCDARVNEVHMYDPHAGLSQFRGRGGTDFSPFLIALHNEEIEKPGFAVFYTDGYGCISGYRTMLREAMGITAYNKYVGTKPTRTPRGVELLWLLAPGAASTDAFKRNVPIGSVVRLPDIK